MASGAAWATSSMLEVERVDRVKMVFAACTAVGRKDFLLYFKLARNIFMQMTPSLLSTIIKDPAQNKWESAFRQYLRSYP